MFDRGNSHLKEKKEYPFNSFKIRALSIYCYRTKVKKILGGIRESAIAFLGEHGSTHRPFRCEDIIKK